jgi:DNA polymerase I-like protein with 3'-5' exonuclease and polymerase domains
MNVLILDCETTTYEKGNPFSRRNKLCYVGLQDEVGYNDFKIEYDKDPYGTQIAEIKQRISNADLIVGFNLKFDLHWIRRYAHTNFLDLSVPVWDCQLAEFLLSHQRWPYPDLDEACSRRGLGNKLDTVRSTYWENGIDTPDVPSDSLREYLRNDVLLTWSLYEAQRKEFEQLDPRLYKLFRLQCADLLVLQEMEFNGMHYDTVESLLLAEKLDKELEEIDADLTALVPVDGINWNSNDHVSVVLYGGILNLPCRVRTERILKNGTVKIGEKNGFRTIELPRLVTPLKGTETLPTKEWSDDELIQQNEGRDKPFCRIFSVGEAILKSLKAKGKAAKIIAIILKRSKLEKLNSTYYRGLPEVIIVKDWPDGVIHGQFNQCVAVTGRLSSSNPNQQNFAGEIKNLFYSRYNKNELS